MQANLSRSNRIAILAGSLLSLLPLVIWRPHFQRLFFFHDDWDMLDGAVRLGLGRWLAEPFVAEGVFPVFKLLWFGALHLTGGSYFGLIVLSWLTHALVSMLFGWLLARFGLPPAAVAFTLVAFALSWTNLETLGWSMQWGAQLSIVFWLAAWHLLLDARGLGLRTWGCFLCLLASALCSSRGIISGLVLAVFVWLSKEGSGRVRLALVCMAPTILLTAVMWLFVRHHQFSPGPALLYSFEYWLLNPLFRPLPVPRHGFEIGALLVCGAIKVAVWLGAFREAKPSWRPLLWTLVCLDLVVAASVGYARAYTGLATVTSSRYQYIPLLCFGPMAGILVSRLRPAAQAGLIIVVAVGLTLPWKSHIEQWATWRGSQLRAAIEQAGPAEHFDPSSLTAGRARELMKRYGLH